MIKIFAQTSRIPNEGYRLIQGEANKFATDEVYQLFKLLSLATWQENLAFGDYWAAIRKFVIQSDTSRESQEILFIVGINLKECNQIQKTL